MINKYKEIRVRSYFLSSRLRMLNGSCSWVGRFNRPEPEKFRRPRTRKSCHTYEPKHDPSIRGLFSPNFFYFLFLFCKLIY
ncbi:hypothetical protein Hanom_Chr16g01515011 [Helianthus anomalus]